MKPMETIKADTQIQRIDMTDRNGNLFGGTVLPRGAKRALNFVCSIDNGKWEHVSVSIPTENKKVPTWEEMCAVKTVFWNDDEEVHEIHPKAKEYFHGFREMQGVLHLWRPVGGWKEEAQVGGHERYKN